MLGHMNVSDLARKLKTTPHELLDKLPALGFDVGRKAIKIDDNLGDRIIQKWFENERRERLRNTLLAGSAKAERPADKPLKEVVIPAVVVVRDLAGKLDLPVTKVIQELMRAGILASQNERLDYETAAIISEELGFKASPEVVKKEDAVEMVQATDRVKEVFDQEDVANFKPRPPVIVVMGHVDHGKTKLLDAIRETNVMGGEAGGITQHIGAYQVHRKNRDITFIDTPGHEAFTIMRSRGAKIADIAILVVAADDGVQPQTKEALSIIQAAKLPFIVALNKMDKPDVDVERILAQLSELGVQTELWGGPVPIAKISAKTKMGIDEILDVILLVADLNADKIRANPDRLAVGTIIESHLDKGEGPVATVLIQAGTLHRNESLGIAGGLYGRVRSMRDWSGKNVDGVTPGMPAKVLGFKVLPAVGDILEIPKDPKELELKKAKTSMQVASQMTATKQAKQPEEEGVKAKQVLNIILKADTLGSLEALLGMFEKVRSEDVGVEVIQKGLGNVNETDISRAEASKPSVVYAFSVVPTPQSSIQARDKGVDVFQSKIIYEIFDDMVARLNKLVPPEVIVTHLGNFETVAVFRTETGRMVVGGKVKEGKMVANAKVRVWRGEEPIGEGVIESVQIGKQVMKEAAAGQECGLSYKGKVKLQAGDRIEAYHEEVKERKFVVPRA